MRKRIYPLGIGLGFLLSTIAVLTELYLAYRKIIPLNADILIGWTATGCFLTAIVIMHIVRAMLFRRRQDYASAKKTAIKIDAGCLIASFVIAAILGIILKIMMRYRFQERMTH